MTSQFEITLFDNNNNHVSLFASLRNDALKTSDKKGIPHTNTALAVIKRITPPYDQLSISGVEWRELSTPRKLKEFIESAMA